MAVGVDGNLCNGCAGEPDVSCVVICPGDLMTLDAQTLRAYCRRQDDCWNCCACVKVCPAGAVAPRLSYTIALYGSGVWVEPIENGFRWTFTDERGDDEVFDVVNGVR